MCVRVFLLSLFFFRQLSTRTLIPNALPPRCTPAFHLRRTSPSPVVYYVILPVVVCCVMCMCVCVFVFTMHLSQLIISLPNQVGAPAVAATKVTIAPTLGSSRSYASGVRKITLIPGDGIGPEISAAVQKIFATANVPIEWETVDVTPVRVSSSAPFAVCFAKNVLISVESGPHSIRTASSAFRRRPLTR